MKTHVSFITSRLKIQNFHKPEIKNNNKTSNITSRTPPVEYFKTRKKAFVRGPFSFAARRKPQMKLNDSLLCFQDDTNYNLTKGYNIG